MSFGFAVDVSSGVNVGQLLDASLFEGGMSHKEAALQCGMQESKLSEGIDGIRPLDLWHLRHLPLRVWLLFFGKFWAALVTLWCVDFQRPYRMVKADLRPADKKGRIA